MKTTKVLLIALAALHLFTSRVYAQLPASNFTSPPPRSAVQINWMSWDEAMEMARKEKRKVLLDVYTESCKWCKYMENTTFQQPEIVRYINEHFYPVKFDAEQRKELEYRGKVFRYVRNGQMGYHELAAELLRGRLSFPALVFLDEEMTLIQSFAGYKTPQQLEQIATYFATDQYKKTPWSTYQKHFKSFIAD